MHRVASGWWSGSVSAAGKAARSSAALNSTYSRRSIEYKRRFRFTAPNVSDTKLALASQPLWELVTLRNVIARLNETNRTVIKKEVLSKDGAALKELLLFIYDPHVRMHIRPDGLAKHIERSRQLNETLAESGQPHVESVLELLQELQSKKVTGHAAIARIDTFLQSVEAEEERLGLAVRGKNALTIRRVFLRCLSRNLKAGVNCNTIQDVFGEVSTGESKSKRDEWGLEPFPASCIALGKASNVDDIKQLLLFNQSRGLHKEGKHSWYLSRKLDGVRCIVRVNVDASKGIQAPLAVQNIETFSRSGRRFTSLDVLTNDLSRMIGGCHALVSLLEEEHARITRATGEAPFTVRLYLDGELCALAPSKEGDEGYVEDFKGIAGQVQRKDYTVPNPAFFPFDILTQQEFEQWKTKWAGSGPDPRQPFYLRKRRVDGLADHCQQAGSIIVRKLDQKLVTQVHEVEEAVREAAEKGWEGFIFRLGKEYEGKRTTAIRKLKEWSEAEYVVRGTKNALMRLPVDQLYQEREALASVTIAHKRTEVSVGSGFSVEERLRYGRDPDLIIGKQITVQYFGESTSADRASATELSLRFPRVKKVWEEGERKI